MPTAAQALSVHQVVDAYYGMQLGGKTIGLNDGQTDAANWQEAQRALTGGNQNLAESLRNKGVSVDDALSIMTTVNEGWNFAEIAEPNTTARLAAWHGISQVSPVFNLATSQSRTISNEEIQNNRFFPPNDRN